MEIRRALPHPRFRGVLRAFEERQAELGSAVLSWPVPARPHQVLNIHLGQPYAIRINEARPSSAPEMSLIGPQTHHRAHVFLSGSVHVFNIVFQPAGLNRLIGIDMTSLIDQDPIASDVLGHRAVVLGDAVRRADDFFERVVAVEHWVETLLEGRGPDCAIGDASRQMIGAPRPTQIKGVVSRSGLSASQFQRRFVVQVGMSPKLFTRIVRFERALLRRRNGPKRPWTEIIHELGYFDQAHFIRDCRAFAGLPPGRLIGDWNNIFFPADDRNLQS